MNGLCQNRGQEQAAAHMDGPLLVLSCPGSGKTTTLMRRVGSLIEAGVPAERILTVTFTKQAAKAMKEKYRELYGEDRLPCFSTIHALCLQMLKSSGLTDYKAVVSGSELEEVLKGLVRSGRRTEKAKEFSVCYSAARNTGLPLDRVETEKMKKEEFLDMAERYEEWKRREGRLDFDDMLLMALDHFRHDEGFRKTWSTCFSYIQCDEYQDVNPVQKELLYYLAGERRCLCAVGDDDQSIYRFRGADPKVMFDFKKDLAPVTTVSLGINYRSCQAIVNTAGAFIKKNRDRFDKEFVSFRGQKGETGRVTVKKLSKRSAQMDFMAKEIDERRIRGVPYEEMAILVRTNRQTGIIGEGLEKYGIPFYSPEPLRSIYDEWPYKDIQSYLNLALGGGDNMDLMQILNKPQRYLSREAYRGRPFELQALLDGIRKEGRPWKLVKSDMEKVTDFYNTFRPGSLSLDDAPSRLFAKLSSVRYPDIFREADAYTRSMKAAYRDMENDARGFETIRQWMEHARRQRQLIAQKNRERDSGAKGVRLMTMHRSKGLEWDTVFLPDIIEDVMPSREGDLQEERRLMYVAMTRAKDCLYILSYGRTSAFFDELRKRR